MSWSPIILSVGRRPVNGGGKTGRAGGREADGPALSERSESNGANCLTSAEGVARLGPVSGGYRVVRVGPRAKQGGVRCKLK